MKLFHTGQPYFLMLGLLFVLCAGFVLLLHVACLLAARMYERRIEHLERYESGTDAAW